MTASARRQGQNQDRQISQQKIVNTLAHVRAEQQKEEHNQKVQWLTIFFDILQTWLVRHVMLIQVGDSFAYMRVLGLRFSIPINK